MRRRAAIATGLALAACSEAPPPPAPEPEPSAIAGPAPATSPRTLRPGELPSPELDGAQPVAGAWEFGTSDTGSAARYGVAGGDAWFVIRCDRRAGRVALALATRATGAATLRVVTGDAAATFPARLATDGARPMLEARVTAGQTFLDALSRAETFAAAGGDGAARRLPGSADIGRVVRSCRPG